MHTQQNACEMKEVSSRTESGGTCPVKHDNNDVNLSEGTAPSGPSPSNWWNRLSSSLSKPSPPKSPFADNESVATTGTGLHEPKSESVCPVSKDSKLIPASLEEAARYAQTPQPDQTIPLALDREVSSIPRGSATLMGDDDSVKNPDHQLIHNDHDTRDSSTVKKWVYPSEQQMYNAMRKKGWTNVPEESIPVVLKIHNHINESTWNQILDWENVKSESLSSSSPQVQLVRFQGRPNDMSPKAFIFSTLLRLYDPPFDRHDWYVQNNHRYSIMSGSDSRIQRYVIDYYYLPPPNPNMPPIPYIDARPALDHPYAFYLHARRFIQLAFPGITAYLKKHERE